jgi:large conductance mechanosensitive channel
VNHDRLNELLKKELRRTTSFVEKFKAFVRRGNVIDLAIGVIIGGAFGKIVSSLVSDVLMPPLGLLLARIDLHHLKWVLKKGSDGEDAVAINYGVFLGSVLDFLLVALVIFLAVEAIHRLYHAPPPPETVECPFCASIIARKARRCAHCTSELPHEEAAADPVSSTRRR